ncbi:MAG: polysaccharide deacetylase family protein [Prolixibacteraceae bacterium]|nr:polysaccharide deacetylase family protein [Prolixibacteraceae bacterium]
MAIILSISIMILFLVYASFSVRSGVYLPMLNRLKTNEKVVSLTFDDGIDPVQTSKVLDILKENNIEACFFLIGKRAEAHPEIIKRMVGEGHIVGNHSYAHTAAFPFYPPKKMTADLQKNEEIIHKTTGLRMKLFRPPYGVTNPLVARTAKTLRYTPVGWSIRSFDTKNHSAEKVLQRIGQKIHPGGVILLHDDRTISSELIEKLVRNLLEQGFSIRRIDKLFGIEAYE